MANVSSSRIQPAPTIASMIFLFLLSAPSGAQTEPTDMARTRFRGIEMAVVDVVQKVRKSTVAIFALRKVTFEGQSRFAAVSGGSGVIIDDDGYILTNDHVAGHCDAIQVVLQGGRKLPATLVAKDEKGDIALLKIDGKRFPAATLGDSDKVQIGQWVVAVGNPFFLGADGEPVVTIGVISGKNRMLGGRWEYADAIQIDAEINPGNSGGPLFNLKGELIGINGKIATRHGLRANTGAGYAIPIDVIKSYLPTLRRGQNIQRGYSGITLDNQSPARGVRIQKIARGSPAEKERLKEGDVILTVNGKAINNAREYANYVGPITAGKVLSLKIKREGRLRTVRLELAMDPSRAQPPPSPRDKKKKTDPNNRKK